MSWQAYLDDNLMCEIGRGNRLSEAAIVGQDGYVWGRGNRLSEAAIVGQDGYVWAQSDSFPAIKPEEVTAIVNGFDVTGSLALTGLFIEGTEYTISEVVPGAVIRGKKVNDSSLAPRRMHIAGTKYDITQREPGAVIGGKKSVYIGGTTYEVIQGERGPASGGKNDKPEKVMGIVNDFAKPGYLATTGIHIGGTKYMIIQGEPEAVTREKKGSAGVTIKKTTRALIFGLYDEPVTPDVYNMIVEFGDNLILHGY